MEKAREVLCLIVMGAVLWAGSAAAAGAKSDPKLLPGPSQKAVQGVVNVAFDDNLAISAVTLKDDRQDPPVVYKVTLDDKGREMAQAMDGVKVEVTGSVVKTQEAVLLTVKTFKAAGGKGKGE